MLKKDLPMCSQKSPEILQRFLGDKKNLRRFFGDFWETFPISGDFTEIFGRKKKSPEIEKVSQKSL